MHSPFETLYDKASRLFFEASLEGDVTGVIKAAQQFFRCPILVGSTNDENDVIYQYPATPIGVESYDVLIEQRRPTTAAFMQYNKDYYDLVAHQPHGTLVFVEGTFADGRPLWKCVDIFDENACGAHVLLYLDYPPTDDVIECIQLFIRVLKSEMRKTRFTQKFSLSKKLSCFREILDYPKSSPVAATASEALARKAHGNYQIMVSTQLWSVQQQSYSSFCCNQIMRHYPHTLCTAKDDCLVILLFNQAEQCASNGFSDTVRSIAGFLSESSGAIGLSAFFSDISDTASYYTQAYHTACVGHQLEPNRHIHHFYEYTPYLFFDMALGTFDGNPFALLHPKFVEIMEYDRLHGSSYLKTLHAYIFAMGNKPAAAQELCIHVNTLLYRLTRLEENFSIDLNDTKFWSAMVADFLFFELYTAQHPSANFEMR